MTRTTTVSVVDPSAFDLSMSSGPAEALRQVVSAAEAVDSRSPLNEAALLSLRHTGLTGSTLFLADSAATGDTAAVEHAAGFALVTGDEVNLVVHPKHRGQGVGARLAWAVLGECGERPLTAWSHGNHPAAAALAASSGFTPVRDLWLMRRPLRDPLPPLREADDVAVRRFVVGQDEEAFLALNAAAFAQHPEQGRLSLDDLQQREAEPWFDPDGFFLAYSTRRPRELLGFHWTKVHDDEDPAYGEVYVVGVSPTAQGAGLGKLLTLTGLHHLRDQGLAEVVLYVEADNVAAVTVYRGLGFTHADADTDVMYARV